MIAWDKNHHIVDQRHLQTILFEVAIKNDVRPEEILTLSRNRRVCWPRQEVMHRWSSELNLSDKIIGRFLGGLERTTVLHGRRAYKKRQQSGRENMVGDRSAALSSYPFGIAKHQKKTRESIIRLSLDWQAKHDAFTHTTTV